MQTLGDKIYALRKQKGLSQEELGFEIDVSRQTVSKWESNSMQPNLENIKNLCSVFQVSLSYFLEEDATLEVVADRDDFETNQICELSDNKVSPNKRLGLFWGISICSVKLFVLSSIICIIIGLTAFTANIGDDTITNYKFDISSFIICLIVTIVFLTVAIIFCVKAISLQKSKL